MSDPRELPSTNQCSELAYRFSNLPIFKAPLHPSSHIIHHQALALSIVLPFFPLAPETLTLITVAMSSEEPVPAIVEEPATDPAPEEPVAKAAVDGADASNAAAKPKKAKEAKPRAPRKPRSAAASHPTYLEVRRFTRSNLICPLAFCSKLELLRSNLIFGFFCLIGCR